MGTIIGFIILGVPCAVALIFFMTPKGKDWLKSNNLL